MRGLKLFTYSPSTCGVSRSGSTVMKRGVMPSALGPSLSSAADMTCRPEGQTSGQLVKPNQTSIGLPANVRSVTFLPSGSSKLNGPPMSALPVDACWGSPAGMDSQHDCCRDAGCQSDQSSEQQ